MFLAGSRIALMPNGPAAARDLARLGHGAAIVASADVPAFTATSARQGLTIQQIGHANGFNAAHGSAIGLDVFTARAAARPPP